MPQPEINDAIFLHSSWRAASTYFWAKFRQRSHTYCYFEPLNEHLFTATADVIERFVPWSFANHPALEAPYLEEYRSLIAPTGGIPGFPAHLTFGKYCAKSNDHLPELEAYINTLAAHADRQGRRPVYGFVRTDLRVAWFRARMPGAHIFIRRDPRRQFLSMLRQAVQGNIYFLLRGPAILRHNLDEPAFAPLLAMAEVRSLMDRTLMDRTLMDRPLMDRPLTDRPLTDSPKIDRSEIGGLNLHESFRDKLADENFLRALYIIFYYMRLLARQTGEPHCHLVIDIDRLSTEDAYRSEIDCELDNLTGLPTRFEDCHVERYEDKISWSAAQFSALEAEIEAQLSTQFQSPMEAMERRASAPSPSTGP